MKYKKVLMIGLLLATGNTACERDRVAEPQRKVLTAATSGSEGCRMGRRKASPPGQSLTPDPGLTPDPSPRGEGSE